MEILFIFESCTFIGVICLLSFVFCLAIIGAIQAFWVWIIYIIYTMLWLFCGMMLSVSNTEKKNIMYIVKTIIITLFPIGFLWSVALFRIHKIEFCNLYPFEGKCLLILLGIVIILSLLEHIFCHINVLLALIISIAITIVPIYIWQPIDDIIAKHDVGHIISFEAKRDAGESYYTRELNEIGLTIKKGEILQGTDEKRYMHMGLTEVRKVIANNEEHWMYGKDLKIHEYVSRYEIEHKE